MASTDRINAESIVVSGVATFSSNVTIGGTLTYEDVTNIDSVGLITARNGINITGGGINVVGVSTLQDLNITGNITSNVTIVSTDTGSSAAPEFKLYRNSASPANADYLGQIKFAGESDTGVERNYAKITGKLGDATNGTEDGIIEFAHIKDGSQNISGRWNSTTLQLLNGTGFSVDGNTTLDGNVDLGNAITDTITATGRFDSGLDPSAAATYDLGAANSWRNINASGIVTATTFVGALTGTATTATNLAGGDTGDIPYQSADGTTTFVDATGAGTGQILLWNGSAPVWDNVGAASGAFGGITVKDEGSTVGTANSVATLDFVGSNIQATASTGANGISTITMSDTPTFDELTVTGISTLGNVSGVVTFANDVHVGSAITFFASSGIVSATAFFGSGGNLEDIITGKIEGLQVQEEGSNVGTGFTFSILNFVGPGVTATAGIGSTATITIPGFTQDADGNLFAGTNAGGGYDPDTGTSLYNIFLGENTGAAIANGDCNIFLGKDSGCATTTGCSNIFLGQQAGKLNTDGTQNVFFGYYAGKCATTGTENFFVGRYAGCSSPGKQNILLGRAAGQVTTGCCNFFVGLYAGRCGTTTNNAIFMGSYAGKCTSGDFNVFLGTQAGCSVTSGQDNIFIGKCSGSGSNLKTGTGNLALGANAGSDLSAGANNIFLGALAGKCNTTGSCNIFIGCSAGCGSNAKTGTGNLALGTQAGSNLSTGDYNILLGAGTGSALCTGGCNVFAGTNAGYCATTGTHNIFLGSYAGKCVTTGCCNIFLGVNAASTAPAKTGNNNIMLGALTGQCLQGGSNKSFLGAVAGQYIRGSYNIGIGDCAGRGSQASSSGGCNVSIGKLAGGQLRDGADNVLLGRCAAYSNYNGNDRVAIGCGSGYTTTNGDYSVYIGKGTGYYSAGYYNIAIGCGSLTGFSPS